MFLHTKSHSLPLEVRVRLDDDVGSGIIALLVPAVLSVWALWTGLKWLTWHPYRHQ